MDLSRLLSDDREDDCRGDGGSTPRHPPAVSAPLFFPPSVALPPVASPPRASQPPLSLPQGARSPPRAPVPQPLPAAFGLGAVAGGWGPPLEGDRPLVTPSAGLSYGDRRPLRTPATPPGTEGVLVKHEPSLPSLRQLGIGSEPRFSPTRSGSVWTPPMARAADAAAAADAAYPPVAYTSPDAVRAAAACRNMAATSATAARGAPSPPRRPPQGGVASTLPLESGARVRLPPTGSAVVPHARHPPVPVPATVAAGGGQRQGASLPGFAALTSTLGVAGAGTHAVGAPADFAAAGDGGARGAAAADSATLWPRRAPYDRGNAVDSGGLAGAPQPPAAGNDPGWGWGAPHGAAAAVDWHSVGGGGAAALGRRSSRSDEAPASSHRGWVAAPPRGSRSANALPDRPWMYAAIGKRHREAGHVPHLQGGGGRGSGARAGRASAKSFGCTECGHLFGQKGSLHRHINAVHLHLRPHECPTCGKGMFGSALSFWRGRKGDGGPWWVAWCARPVLRPRERLLDPLCGCSGLELTCLSMRFGCACCVSFVPGFVRTGGSDGRGVTVAFATKWSLYVHDRNVHQQCKPHACRVCDKMFGEMFNRNKVRSTLLTGARAHASRVDPWCCGPSPRQRGRARCQERSRQRPSLTVPQLLLFGWRTLAGVCLVYIFSREARGQLASRIRSRRVRAWVFMNPAAAGGAIAAAATTAGRVSA